MLPILKALEQLFASHAPETLMAFFGAGTSLLLFALVWAVLRNVFRLSTHHRDQEVDQDQAATELVEALVSALVSEAGYLRQTLNHILEEALRSNKQNTQQLARLVEQTEALPASVVHLLKPEFDTLHQALHQTEGRIMTHVVAGTSLDDDTPEKDESAS